VTAYATPPLSMSDSSRADAAASGLSFLLLVLAAVFGCWVIGTRPLDIGTDTSVYAGFYESLGHSAIHTRLEPGFVFVSYLVRKIGFGVIGYQVTLFALLLLFAYIACLKYFRYIGGGRGFPTFLTAAITLLFVSPMFMNGAINAVRQGLAALLIFSALLSFHRRQWFQFLFFGGIATSFHLSSLMYLACAPALLVNAKALRWLAALAFALYVSGLSMKLVQGFLPQLYTFVQEYAANPDYRSGVRVDFAVFSIFWYVLPHMLAPLIRESHREAIVRSAAVYLVMVLPFFAVGWGSYSNRFLLPAWLAASLIVAAVLCYSRLTILRNPLLIQIGLVAACGALYYYVSNGIVI
jgi:hypothetical protein